MNKELKNNPLVQKSFLAVEIVKFGKTLITKKKEFLLSKQIIRSGTSIGANIEKAKSAISNADFKNKISIAYKESKETLYWLRLLHETGYIYKSKFEKLQNDCDEIFRMLRATLNTMNKKILNS
jgi:four helix bundle protein